MPYIKNKTVALNVRPLSAFSDLGYFSCDSRGQSPLTIFEIHDNSKQRNVSPLANRGRPKRKSKTPARFVGSSPLSLKSVDLEQVPNLRWREFSSIGQLGKETWVYVLFFSTRCFCFQFYFFKY